MDLWREPRGPAERHDPDPEAGSQPGSDPEAGSQSGSDPEAGSQSGSDPEAGSQSGSDPEAGSQSGVDSGAGPSCLSLKSDRSMRIGVDFKEHTTPAKRRKLEEREVDGRRSSILKSPKTPTQSRSRKRLRHEESTNAPTRVKMERPSASQRQPRLDSVFMLLEEHIDIFMKSELKKMKMVLSSGDSECLESEDDDQRSSSEFFVKMALLFLRKMEEYEVADRLQSKTLAAACQRKLKSRLKEQSQCVFEGISHAAHATPLRQIYTELDITEGGSADVNREHEVGQIEAVYRKSEKPEKKIQLKDLFKPVEGRRVRTVMTKGVAGIGKTVLTQKFTMEWAEGAAHQDFHFTFPFNFRELNLLREEPYSLVQLIHHFFSETREAGICRFEDFRVLFVFNGLDECRLPLGFHVNQPLSDPQESTSLDVLLTNLIRGNLLPNAHIWITTRPAAANQIPPDAIDKVTEVHGFSDARKEEYFRNRFGEEKQASRFIAYIQTSRTFHVLCHIPAFCWITATVAEEVLRSKDGEELPRTLTEMYIHFLLLQTKLKKVKYEGGAETDQLWSLESINTINSLGKLAFEQLQTGNLIFYESDLRKCGIDVRAASVYSGLFTQIFKEQGGLIQGQVFSFIHLSFQEFLAALYVHLTFINYGVNVLKGTIPTKKSEAQRDVPAQIELYQSAVDEALRSPNGHLDLFLRFLLGLSLQSNQNLLQGLMPRTPNSSLTNRETIQHIRIRMSGSLAAERSINLFHCLNELNDRSLEEEVRRHLSSGRLTTDRLSPAQWAALVFILLSSKDGLDQFDLRNYSASEDALLRLLPVVKVCDRVLLRGCGLSKRSCEGLASILSSQSSSLKELDLSNNDLQDEGVKLLAAGLKSPHCKLDTLRLSGCLITEEGCDSLASALTSNTSPLRELDLAYNHPGDAGASRIRDAFKGQNLRLEPRGARWMKPGLRKYSCELTLDANSTNKWIRLSEDDRKATHVEEEQPYPDHPDRFDYFPQVLCRDGLTGRCYWEVEWTGKVHLSVSYRGIRRKGNGAERSLGDNALSWTLSCSDKDGFSFHHNKVTTAVPASSASSRVAVFVDQPAGTLSFYSVSPGSLIHLHTLNTTFKEPLYAGFRFGFQYWSGSSVSLCSL